MSKYMCSKCSFQASEIAALKSHFASKHSKDSGDGKPLEVILLDSDEEDEEEEEAFDDDIGEPGFRPCKRPSETDSASDIDTERPDRKKKKREAVFACVFCPRKLTEAGRYQAHLFNSHTSLWCKACDYTAALRKMGAHLRARHGRPAGLATYSSMLRWNSEAKEKAAPEVSNVTVPAKPAQVVFPTAELMMTSDGRVQCARPNCGFTTENLDELDEHVEEIHTEDEHRAPVAATPSSFVPREKWNCPYCMTVDFGSAHDLRTHLKDCRERVKAFDDDKKWTCPFCLSADQETARALRRHLTAECTSRKSAEAPPKPGLVLPTAWPCPFCELAFPSKTLFCSHLATRDTNRCTEKNCSYVSCKSDSLRTHLRSNHWQCLKCNFNTTEEDAFRKHYAREHVKQQKQQGPPKPLAAANAVLSGAREKLDIEKRPTHASPVATNAKQPIIVKPRANNANAILTAIQEKLGRGSVTPTSTNVNQQPPYVVITKGGPGTTPTTTTIPRSAIQIVDHAAKPVASGRETFNNNAAVVTHVTRMASGPLPPGAVTLARVPMSGGAGTPLVINSSRITASRAPAGQPPKVIALRPFRVANDNDSVNMGGFTSNDDVSCVFDGTTKR